VTVYTLETTLFSILKIRGWVMLNPGISGLKMWPGPWYLGS